MSEDQTKENEPIPIMQRILDDPFLLLAFGSAWCRRSSTFCGV